MQHIVIVAATRTALGKFAGTLARAAATERGASVAQRKGDPVVFDADEFNNRKTSAEALAGLRPAFDKSGSAAACHASGLNDGAAGGLVMSASKAAALDPKPLSCTASNASAGLDPALMSMGPAPAARQSRWPAGWQPAELGVPGIKEPFAAQPCTVHAEMGWNMSKVNVNRGWIAVGHPIGASGFRNLVRLIHAADKRDAHKGVASLRIGGGIGVALTLER